MRRSNIQKVLQVSGNYKCYVESRCNYSTNNYDILKKHIMEHNNETNANKVKGRYNILKIINVLKNYKEN